MKKYKKYLMFMTIFSFCTITLWAKVQPIHLVVNSQLVNSNASPIQESGTTLVPIRVVSEELGAVVEWNKEQQQITITKGNTIVKLTVGSKKAFINDVEKDLSQVPVVKNGYTFVPIRFIAEAFKMPVEWDSSTWTVAVNTPVSTLAQIVPKNEVKKEETNTQTKLKMYSSFPTVPDFGAIYGVEYSNYSIQEPSVTHYRDGSIEYMYTCTDSSKSQQYKDLLLQNGFVSKGSYNVGSFASYTMYSYKKGSVKVDVGYYSTLIGGSSYMNNNPNSSKTLVGYCIIKVANS